jgi:hypothetical protein
LIADRRIVTLVGVSRNVAPSSLIKRALKEAGFEVYGTQGDTVAVAERVRENLIMDSGIRVGGSRLAVSFYVRTEQRDFPAEEDDALFARARKLGAAAIARGYEEQRAFVTRLPDPGDAERTLDNWYQVQFEKRVDDVELAIEEVRFAFGLQKTARR